MQEFALIVAGGSGSRMKSDLPKQFLAVGGRPVLMHTLAAFRRYSPTLALTLVLPQSQFGYWQALCKAHDFDVSHTFVAGGSSRFHSVQNGLAGIGAAAGLVAVHDGVRPFVSSALIAAGYRQAALSGSAVAAVALKDSPRHGLPDGTSHAIDRSAYRLVQTPQTFRLDWMRRAFATEDLPHFTDCASVLEQSGYPIGLIEGDYQNIKLTTPEDLLWAEAFLTGQDNF